MKDARDAGRFMVSRRNLLKAGAGVVAAGAGALGARQRAFAQTANTSMGDSKARNVIFMVSDGMSPSVPALAEAFSQLVRGTQTNWARLSQSQATTHGWFDMASLNSLVTDSAAAASAWATGSRINNWALNTLPDGRTLTPIGVLAKQAGHHVGLVTNTRLTHATPAAFIASTPTRNLEAEIATQYLNAPDVLLGGGAKFFDKGLRPDRRDLFAEFAQGNYQLARTRDSLKQVGRAEKILGVFHNDHLPYVIDRRREQTIANETPTLAEMTAVGLNALSASKEGFLLQVEGGRVDHAAHVNDAAAMLWEQIEFDDAIGEVMQFVQQRPDTLVVITSDHGCGNPGLNGMGSLYQMTNDHFERIAASSKSFFTMHKQLQASSGAAARQLAAEDVAQVILEGTGIEISMANAVSIADAFNGNPSSEISQFQSDISGIVAQVLGNHHGVSWMSVAHTSDWTPILAFGAQRERFHGLLKNTQAFTHMAEVLGIDFRNPAMSADEARGT